MSDCKGVDMDKEGTEWGKIVECEREADRDVAEDYMIRKYGRIISIASSGIICKEILNEMYREIGDQALYVMEKMRAGCGDHPRNTMIKRYVDRHFIKHASILNEFRKGV